jgi:hypothetical protein
MANGDITQRFRQFREAERAAATPFPTAELEQTLESPEQIIERVRGSFAPTQQREQEFRTEEIQGAEAIVGRGSGPNLNTFNEAFIGGITKRANDRLKALDKEIKAAEDSGLATRAATLRDIKLREFEAARQLDAQIAETFFGLTSAQQGERGLDIQEAGITGEFEGRPTFQAREAEFDRGFREREFVEGVRQFNVGTEQQNRTFEEGVRQFNITDEREREVLAENIRQFNTNFNETVRQFDLDQAIDQATLTLQQEESGVNRQIMLEELANSTPRGTVIEIDMPDGTKRTVVGRARIPGGGGSGKPRLTEEETAVVEAIKAELDASRGPDGFVNTEVYRRMNEEFNALNLEGIDFTDVFDPLVTLNPNDPTARRFIQGKLEEAPEISSTEQRALRKEARDVANDLADQAREGTGSFGALLSEQDIPLESLANNALSQGADLDAFLNALRANGNFKFKTKNGRQEVIDTRGINKTIGFIDPATGQITNN